MMSQYHLLVACVTTLIALGVAESKCDDDREAILVAQKRDPKFQVIYFHNGKLKKLEPNKMKLQPPNIGNTPALVYDSDTRESKMDMKVRGRLFLVALLTTVVLMGSLLLYSRWLGFRCRAYRMQQHSQHQMRQMQQERLKLLQQQTRMFDPLDPYWDNRFNGLDQLEQESNDTRTLLTELMNKADVHDISDYHHRHHHSMHQQRDVHLYLCQHRRTRRMIAGAALLVIGACLLSTIVLGVLCVYQRHRQQRAQQDNLVMQDIVATLHRIQGLDQAAKATNKQAAESTKQTISSVA